MNVWILNNKDIIKDVILMIVSIFSFIFAIYKFRGEFWQKTVIQDFEQFNKYFSKNELHKLKQESLLMQDMACRTISVFKGFTFLQLEACFNSEIGLYDLIKILKLKRSNLLEFDKSNNLIVNDKYRKRWFVKYLKTARSYKIVLWTIFILFLGVIGYCIFYFRIDNKLENFLILGILIGFWEILMLVKIENRESVEWFEKEGQKILEKNKFKEFLKD